MKNIPDTMGGDGIAVAIQSFRAKLGPLRMMLRVEEFAEATGVTPTHIMHLIEEGQLLAVDLKTTGNKSNRSCWRIPVTAVGDFLTKKSNQG